MNTQISLPLEILNRAKDLIEPSLKSSIEELNPDIAMAAKYHFGWVDESGQPTGASGKGIRPALAVLSAEYAGADPKIAIPGAVAVELVHNFSLMHDDVIDKDAERRHRPTVWKVFGVEEAIIAGDALLALAFEVLLKEGGENSVAALSELASATSLMIAGQRADMAVSGTTSVEDCQNMESKKTGALLSCSASIGALMAGADEATISALRDYGMQLGLAFQAVDDLLGIWGDSAITGKPAGNDIREKKKSLPIVLGIVAAEKKHPQMHQSLTKILAKDNLRNKDIDSIIQILEELEVKEATQKIANQHLDLSIQALQRGLMAKGEAPQKAQEELAALAKFATNRDF